MAHPFNFMPPSYWRGKIPYSDETIYPMTQPTFLRVFPNPWHTFDHEGQPIGTVPFDPSHAGTARRWVGARVASADLLNKPKAMMTRRTKDGRVDTLYSEEPVHRILWAFEMVEASLLPPIPYYLAALRAGELIPADEATATRAGVPFLPREQAIEAARTAGIEAHFFATGAEPDQTRWPACLRAPTPADEATPVPA